jgi:hypothetical protein
MTEQRECDCCKLKVQTVSEDGLCFSCDAFHAFASIIKEETDLNEDETLDLAGDPHEYVLSIIMERLQLPGQEHPLVMELLQIMVRLDKPN